MKRLEKPMSITPKRPIILLLGSEIQCFPWESTQSLGSMEVTRMPSIHSFLDLGEEMLSRHTAEYWNIII